MTLAETIAGTASRLTTKFATVKAEEHQEMMLHEHSLFVYQRTRILKEQETRPSLP